LKSLIIFDKRIRRKLSILTVSIFLIGCNYQERQTSIDDKYETSNKNRAGWTILNCGLYINSKGQIGFPTRPDYVFKDNELQGEDKMCPNRFLVKLNDSIPLNEVIDTNSFIALGVCFYKDKSAIYFYYAMCDGGYFRHFSNDTSNFKVLNSCYVSHNNSIYYSRGRQVLDVDFNSFKYSTKYHSIARDKNGYFEFGERKSKEEIEKSMGDLFIGLNLKSF
jgi:hypothetical protein